MEDSEINRLVEEYYPEFVKHIYNELGFATSPTVEHLKLWERWKESLHRKRITAELIKQ